MKKNKSEQYSNCICIGNYAGYDLTDEKLLFCLSMSDWKDETYQEARTNMTEEEYEVISRVLLRALENKVEKKKPVSKWWNFNKSKKYKI